MTIKLTRRDVLGLGLAGLALPSCQLLKGRPAPLEFAEQHLAGTETDFLVARYLRLKGQNRAIGEQLAKIARARHKTALGSTAQLANRKAFFKANYAAHYERAQGVADHYGVKFDDADGDVFGLLYDLDVAPACSTVFYPGASTQSGHATVSRNFDFSMGTFAEMTGRKPPKGARPMTSDPYVIEMRPDQGIPALYLCSYDLLIGCVDGMNAEGLSVALLANDHERGQPTGGARPGLGEVELARYLLDTCRNIDEARAALQQLPLYYAFVGCHYLVGDRKGRSFVFEYTPDLSQRFFVEGKGKPQMVTNHPLHAFEGKELPADAELGSFSRYARLQKEVETRGVMSAEDVKATNRCVMQRFTEEAPRGRPPVRTLWHAVYDLDALTLDVDFYLGDDLQGSDLRQRRSGYKTFKL